MKYNAHECWAFAWSTGRTRPYICGITEWTRTELIKNVEKQMGEPWDKIYRRGGRAVKCQIVQKETP